MNKFTFQTIRAGFVLGFGLFLAVSTVFASATIISTQTSEITDTSAVLTTQYENPGENSYVHFEWAQYPAFPTNIAGTQSFSTGSSFDTTLDGLNPDTTYSYRAVIVARPITGGAAEAPVYSPIVSFTTAPTKLALSQTSSSQSGNNGAQGSSTSGSKTTTTNTTATNTSNTSSSGNATTQNSSAANGGFTNNNAGAASVIGSGIFPNTLTGWIILLIALFIILLIGRLIYEESERRKKVKAAKKAQDALIEAEKKANEIKA